MTSQNEFFKLCRGMNVRGAVNQYSKSEARTSSTLLAYLASSDVLYFVNMSAYTAHKSIRLGNCVIKFSNNVLPRSESAYLNSICAKRDAKSIFRSSGSDRAARAVNERARSGRLGSTAKKCSPADNHASKSDLNFFNISSIS
uniref:Uncharacterized protein n=1 Tax=Romanomermis culicivorax TaxID=13658 RepID=A0A915JV83_ROMCU